MRQRVLAGKADDALRRAGGDGLDADGRILLDRLPGPVPQLGDQLAGAGVPGGELDARVEVFRVLADDDEVDVGDRHVHARVRPAGAHAGEEVELLAQRDVHGAEPLPDGGRDRALERHAVLADGLERLFRQRRLELLDGRFSGDPLVPLERHPGCLEAAPGRPRDLRTDPVSGDEGHTIGHQVIMACEAIV